MNTDVAGGVTGGGGKADFVVDDVVGFHQVGQACIEYGEYGLLTVASVEMVFFVLSESPFGGTKQIAGIGKGRYPFIIDFFGVPADMVKM